MCVQSILNLLAIIRVGVELFLLILTCSSRISALEVARSGSSSFSGTLLFSRVFHRRFLDLRTHASFQAF